MNFLIPVAVALVAGLMMTRVFKLLHLNFPDVTAFLLAGVAIGPYGLGRLGVPGLGFSSMESLSQVSVISSVALGFIAFAIGNEFRLSQLKHTGKQATIIGILQACVATLTVDLVLLGLHFILGGDLLPLPAVITLGAIAAATAPAATLMVVRQYKAKGKLTDLLLPIVALDDAVGLVIFAVSFGVAEAMVGGSMSLSSVVLEPLLEITGSLALGALLGCILTLLEKLFFSNTNRLSLTIAFVLITIALSAATVPLGGVTLRFSSLLVCMMLGTVFCNLCPRSADIMDRADKWTAPIYCLFFVLSGAELELSVFADMAVVGIGMAYIIARSAGKYLGALGSSALVGCDHKVRQYLGITLLPQAGVALGMSASAAQLGTDEGRLIRNITLFGVMIYELVGPALTRWALEKAGEIRPAAAEKKTVERFNRPAAQR